MKMPIGPALNHLLLLPLLAGLAACDGGPPELPPEVAAERLEARSRACLGAEISRKAEEDLLTLQDAFGGDPGNAAATLARQAGAYAAAFQQHALLREIAAAQQDSAFNHSAAPADSLRHEQRASQVAIVLPQQGTLEANVIAAYERQMAALLSDADHPCNWNLDDG